MYVKANDVDEAIVLKIDRKARKIGCSRSEYLKLLMTKDVIEDEVVETENKYIVLTKSVLNALEKSTAALTKFESLLVEIETEKLNERGKK